MFNGESIKDEIYRSMEKSLIANQVEDQHGFNKLAQATDLLNTASAIFDQAGMLQESNAIAQILLG